MKLLIFLLFINQSKAAELIIINHTEDQARITSLHNKCDNNLITEEKQIILNIGENYTIKNITPVVQSYTICGSGYCESSAIGMKNASEYTLEVVINGGYITGIPKPDDWVGNLECPNEKN